MSLHHFRLHKLENFICVWSDHWFRLWLNKNVPCHMTWAVVGMTCCCNSVILLEHLEPGVLSSSSVHFSKYSIQQRGQGRELIHPVQNHLTLVSLVSIFDTFSDTLSGFISIRETRVLSLNWLGFLSSMSFSSGREWGDWIVHVHLCWSILTDLFSQTGLT